MSIKELFKLVLGWRVLLVLIALPAMFLLPPRTRFTNLTEKPSLGNVFSMWSNFDGLHYLDLAQYGYGYQHKTDMDYAFFPVYPWVVGTFNFFGNYLATGLIYSHLFLILALYFLYRLVLMDFSKKVARLTIILTLIFPTAFFFGSVYTESLFLLLVVLTFYLVRRQHFFLACLLAAVASATRITGIFLWPALIYEFWLTYGKDLRRSINLSALWLLLPPLGLLSFMRFQYLKTGDPLFFFHIQSVFGGRTVDKLILLHQVFFRYLKMLMFTDWDPLYFTVVLEILSAVLIVSVLIFFFKKIRFSYWLFVLLSFLLPTFSGTFMSMPRFTLVLFPVFMVLAYWLEKQHPFIKYTFYAVCVLTSILSVIFFTRGYFVA
ncbi:MAG: hypothetical protein UW64_C0003G0025 [Microgenomates group bacterium GW2011_GWC1_44_37]|nr:MAG: hypothetical protein UW31_C0005G0024 [Candidatus Collierbacteria bacterium GW2011_GWA2_44_13]KKT62695.1 MAG: hypothetical protein UW56_C0004G0008 [Candidatus Collierbacteria bacterium GW2011_GWD1_44_27]KKT65543.1 MAG: hypothetical protein UW58_C0027G0025 [Candidatus Collierbacteria bacterium GW2011_GWC2_44_30]KKT69175.1 MAG: hypothetical protein UW64_C0003G0025 [Microgenomates group bacterium GW2011_GWC1_44_37]KKT89135.1 MAG: hypothetical protein UW88_C0005G0024 [Candidatus Collierbacte